MSITPLLLALLLTIAPFVHTSETYSLTKADFPSDGTWKEAVTLSAIYTEKAFKVKMEFGTLRSNGTTSYVCIAFDKTLASVTLSTAILCISIYFTNTKITQVIFYHEGTKVAQKATPEDVPTSLTIEVKEGKVSIKELEVDGFGIGTNIEFSAIFVCTPVASYAAWTGGGYITCEISKEVGWTWIFTPLWPAISLYVTVAVMITVIVALMAGIRGVVEK